MAYDFLEALGVMEDSFGRVGGYVAQAWGVWGRPWILQIASWMRLGGVLKIFGGVLKPSRCVERLEVVWRAPKRAQASFEEGLERFLPGFQVFLPGLRPKPKIGKNIDFA